MPGRTVVTPPSIGIGDLAGVIRAARFVAIPTLLCVLGFASLLGTGNLDGDSLLAGLLPVDADPRAAVLAAATAISFFATAVGLLRGKRLSWWLAVVTFAGGLVTQLAFLHHPIAGLVALGILAVLFADRRRYIAQSAPMWRWIAVAAVLVTAIGAVAETALIITATGRWPGPLQAIGDITAGLANGFGVDDDLAQTIFGTTSIATLVGVLIIVARLPVVLVSVGLLSPAPDRPIPPAARARARTILERWGRGALLPFQRGDDTSAFVSASGEGLIVYGRAGRTAVVLGDPIGPTREAAAAMAEFVEVARRSDRIVAVYQATARSRTVLRAAGFGRIFRIGNEAIIDLASFELGGSRRANLRHTVTRFRRDGGSVRWFPAGLDGDALAELGSDLVDCDDAWTREAGPQLGFTVGRFVLSDLRLCPVAVALDGAGRVIAFVTFRSTGADRGYVLDLMRRRPRSVPGAVETCIAEAALRLRERDVPRLSLGLAPLAGLRVDQGPPEERVLRAAAMAARRWYDVDGLAFFKAKFDPAWEPRYAAVRHRWDAIALATSLVFLHVGDGTMIGFLSGAVRAVRGPRREAGRPREASAGSAR